MPFVSLSISLQERDFVIAQPDGGGAAAARGGFDANVANHARLAAQDADQDARAEVLRAGEARGRAGARASRARARARSGGGSSSSSSSGRERRARRREANEKRGIAVEADAIGREAREKSERW